jgi:isopenicillin N synthase-like dioxygenase
MAHKTSLGGVPVIDLSPAFGIDPTEKAALAGRIDAACRDWGFIIVAGHGVSPELMASMDRVTRAFFATSLAERARVEGTSANSSRGYRRFGNGANGRLLGLDVPPDLRESFRIGPEAVAADPYYSEAGYERFYVPNIWPAEPADLRPVWEAYYAALDALARRLLRVLALALGLRETWFDAKVDRAATELVAQFYPTLDAAPLPDQFRNHPHTDIGTITILKSEDRPNGLQVEDADGAWNDVIPVPGTFIINIGDMMAQWTNDRWRSTMHRVVNPVADVGSTTPRLSVAYFHQPNPDTVIDTIASCIDEQHPKRYAPVRAADYLAERLDRIQGPSKSG